MIASTTGTSSSATTRARAVSGGLLLLALGAPLVVGVPAAHAQVSLPVPLATPTLGPVQEAVASVTKPAAVEPVPEAVRPVASPVAEAAKPVASPVAEAVPAPVASAAAPVTEAVTTPSPRPSSAPGLPGVPVAPSDVEPGTAAPAPGGTVRPASGTVPQPVARPSAPAAGLPDGGSGLAAVDPGRISGGLGLAAGTGSSGGTGVAVAPIAAGMPQFADLVGDGLAPQPLAAPLAAPAAALLPVRPARPTDLPAALVAVAAITVAAVGAAQATELRARRRAAVAT